jgi:hypothetical protein
MEKNRFLLIICPTGRDEEAIALLGKAGASGYTKSSGACGRGGAGAQPGRERRQAITGGRWATPSVAGGGRTWRQ